MGNDKDYITLKEACRLLNVAESTLRNWEKQKLITSVRLGKRGDRRFLKEEILKFLKDNQEGKNEEIDF